MKTRRVIVLSRGDLAARDSFVKPFGDDNLKGSGRQFAAFGDFAANSPWSRAARTTISICATG